MVDLNQQLLTSLLTTFICFSTSCLANEDNAVENDYPYVYKKDDQAASNIGSSSLKKYFVVNSPKLPKTNAELPKTHAPKTNAELPKSISHSFMNNYIPHSDFMITGFGIVSFTKPQREHSYFNMDHFDPNLIFNYDNKFQFETLLDFTLTNDGSIDLNVLYAQLDWFVKDYLTLVGGKFYSPAGKFINTLYLPWLNKLPTTPIGFDYWEAGEIADVGIQARGELPCLFGMKIDYALFLGNGPKFNVEENYIDSDGYPDDQDGNKVGGGRIGFFPTKNLEIGLSGIVGEVGMFEYGELIGVSKDYYQVGTDISYTLKNLQLLFEYTKQQVNGLNDDVIEIDEQIELPDSEAWIAYYIQAAYRFAPSPWEIVSRYGSFQSPSAAQKQRQFALGIDYWFTPYIVAKLAYEINHGNYGYPTDSNQLILQFSMGF